MTSPTRQTVGTREERTERYARAAVLLRRRLSDAEHEDDADYDWAAIEAELRDSTMPTS